MQDSFSSQTSISLLARIGRDDRDPYAWREFVERYGKRIYQWCLSRRLQAADAEDVTQDVLAKLARHLGSFDYDKNQTFRGWLRRMTENAVTDFFRKTRRHGAGRQVDDALTALDQAEAREDLVNRLNEAFDLELLDMAKARVCARVDRRRWLAWEWTAIDQRSSEEVAAELNMTLPTVYSNRYQIQKKIADEIRRLEADSQAAIANVGGASGE